MQTPESPPNPKNPKDPKPLPEDRFNDPVARVLWQIMLGSRFIIPAVMLYLVLRAFWWK
jgi:hypothetical protein